MKPITNKGESVSKVKYVIANPKTMIYHSEGSPDAKKLLIPNIDGSTGERMRECTAKKRGYREAKR